MDNPFVGFETFTKQRTDDEHPYGEDSHLDDDSILERHGDVETGDDYIEPKDNEGPYDEDDDIDLQWGKVSDAAKGAVGAAKSGVASAARTAKDAGTAVGAKVGQAAETAGYAAQDAASTGIAAGQKAAKTAGQAATGFGQQAAQTASAGLTAGKQAAQTAGTAAGAKATDLGTAATQTAKTGAAKAGQWGQAAGQAAGAKVAGAFGKSHDETMSSLDQAIGFMEKQVATDEEAFYDEPTGNRTAVRSVERGDEDILFDAPESIEDFDYDDPTELNTAQREAVQEVAQNRQQGIAENESLTASPEAAEYMELVRRLEKVVSPSGEIREPEANDSPSPSPVASAKRRGVAKNIRRPSQTKGQRVLTPENIATSAVEDRADRAAQTERNKRSGAKKAEMAAARAAAQAEVEDSSITPMSGPNTSSYSDEDDLEYSADNILSKALGSVIDIMEKQFSCQECGTKIPKSSKKCRKCGSEDIDLS